MKTTEHHLGKGWVIKDGGGYVMSDDGVAVLTFFSREDAERWVDKLEKGDDRG